MKKTQAIKAQLKRRHARVRARVSGTAERPRLAVFRSNKYIYAQLIDDKNGMTLASASSLKSNQKSGVDRAKEVGTTLAKDAQGKKISRVVFDRGGFLYAGRVRAVAEGAREGGLIF